MQNGKDKKEDQQSNVLAGASVTTAQEWLDPGGIRLDVTIHLHEEAWLNTSDIAAVYQTKDQMDRKAIGIVLTKAGRKHMFQMTSANIDKYAIIFVNGKAVSAPMMASPVDREFIIFLTEESIDGLF